MYDAATRTFDTGEGPPSFGKELLATIGAILLAPVILVYQGYKKLEEWQNDRNYAFQQEVLKQGPIAVLVTQDGAEDGDKVMTMVKERRYRSLVDHDGVQVVEPTIVLKEGLPRPKWVVLCDDEKKDADYACARYPASIEDLDNIKWQPVGWRIVFGFFDGPGAWEKARQALPCLEQVEIKAEYLGVTNGHPQYQGTGFDFLLTCWYEYRGKIYAYEKRIGI